MEVGEGLDSFGDDGVVVGEGVDSFNFWPSEYCFENPT